MRRVVVPEVHPGKEPVRLTAGAHHHLVHVLRLGPGDSLELVDGSGGRFSGKITRMGHKEVLVEIQRRLPSLPPPSSRLTLLYGLSKGPRTDLVIQKAVELGVDVIVPVCCHRSVVRLDDPDRRQRRHRRWEEIITQAAAQCGRARLPRLSPMTRLAPAMDSESLAQVKLLAHPGGEPLSRFQQDLGARPEQVTLAVGSEGGFDPEEIQYALDRGFKAVDLGPRVLRTETAAVAFTALVAFLMGRLEEPSSAPLDPAP